MNHQSHDSGRLQSVISGSVVSAADDGWEQACAAWNLVADQRPVLAVYAESAEDVAATVDFAREAGLRIAAQGTGHGAGCRSWAEDSILLRTERMNAIEVDGASGVGRFEAGVIWRDAANAASEHGLAVLSGSSPDVGVVGYTIGGGFGWLARRHGLACNSVRAAELVTADGRRQRIDAQNEPDLFWALRGGGGNFGVVTALEFELIRLPEVFAGTVIYPAEGSERDVLHAWREWTDTVPDEVTSIARFLRLPPLPMIPEPLRDRPLVTVGACYAGDPRLGEEIVAPMRQLGEPVMDLFGAMPPAGLVQINMDPEEPVPGLVDTTTLRELPAKAVEVFADTTGPESGSPLLMAALRHAGGRLASPAPEAGALSHLDGAFVLEAVGLPMTPEMGPPILERLASVRAALDPWCTGRRYFNFDDSPTESEGLFDPETLTRLRAVKHRYDPDSVICGNHAIGAKAPTEPIAS